MTDLKTEEVEHLASLSRLSLSGDEKKELSEQLPQILDFVGQLKKADVEKPEYKGISQNDLREDKVDSDYLSLEQLEKLAPKWQKDQVEVPPVFGESGNE